MLEICGVSKKIFPCKKAREKGSKGNVISKLRWNSTRYKIFFKQSAIAETTQW